MKPNKIEKIEMKDASEIADELGLKSGLYLIIMKINELVDIVNSLSKTRKGN